jgi:hypothetical protein
MFYLLGLPDKVRYSADDNTPVISITKYQIGLDRRISRAMNSEKNVSMANIIRRIVTGSFLEVNIKANVKPNIVHDNNVYIIFKFSIYGYFIGFLMFRATTDAQRPDTIASRIVTHKGASLNKPIKQENVKAENIRTANISVNNDRPDPNIAAM